MTGETDMNKKTTVTVLAIVIAAAVFLGFVLLNKGDGPVMGMMFTGGDIESLEDYESAAEARGEGVYMVVTKSINKFNEDYSQNIPEGDDLYAAIHFVECPEGSQYTGKWIKDGSVISEETGTLATGPRGVISYKLEGIHAAEGSYVFELYDGDKKIFEKTFSIR